MRLGEAACRMHIEEPNGRRLELPREQRYPEARAQVGVEAAWIDSHATIVESIGMSLRTVVVENRRSAACEVS